MIFEEPGADVVRTVVEGAMICAVNHGEIVTRLIDRGFDDDEAATIVDRFGSIVLPFDQDLAVQAGVLRRETRAFGLSLGDRACLALAMREKLPVFTADRRWMELHIGVDIRLAR